MSNGIGKNPLNDISKIYLTQVAEKKDDSYLETDMKKRQKNNEKAIADMKKVKDDTVPRWMKESELAEIHSSAHTPHEVPSKNLKKLVSKAVKRIDTDVDGDTDKNDKAKGELGEFIPGVGNKRLYSTTGTRTAKESFSNWRRDLIEVMNDEDEDDDDRIDDKKKVDNKKLIKINPKLGEAIEAIGGTLIEMVEIDENVSTGKARRARFGGIQSKPVGAVSNTEKAAEYAKQSAAKKAKEKSAGEAAHKAASAKGLSPAEAEMRRKAAERKAARMRKEEVEQVDEKLNMKKEKMGDVIKDFYKSDAPQFKGKSKEKRREMAIAAKLTAERGGRKLGEATSAQPQQNDPVKKKQLANLQMMMRKKQDLERRTLQMKKKGNMPISGLEEEQVEEGIGMTMAGAIGNPPALSKRMKLKQALINREIKKNVSKNKTKKYSGKASSEE